MSTVTVGISLVGPRAAGYARRGYQRPAVGLAHRVRALRPDRPFLYAMDLLDPATLPDGWHRPATVLDAMLAPAAPHLRISPAVSAARVTTSLAYAALGRPAVGLALMRRVPDVSAGSLLLRLDDDGLVEQAAVGSPVVAMRAHDPLSGHADAVVVPDDAALVGWLADRALEVLTPLIDDLHRRTRFGVVPMWNLAADTALGPSTVAPLLAGGSQAAGREIGEALVDALVSRGAPIRRRGVAQEVETASRGTALAPVRGSCCLHYRDCSGHPSSGSVCASCPLLDGRLRAERFEDGLPLPR
ncbi:(2Fe-2S)-binding protein [Spongisporangium articulatum]|uniref:(2Fe-2S)-binding protein n=1 Tax=Spongisporangium articulatum TaxID=3362603 RepID=A0ABW8AMC3_9ACTN